MSLWNVREKALDALASSMKNEAGLIDQALQLLEYAAERIAAVEPPTSFSRVTSLVVAKARNLSHCCYSLALDGHAQESGALVRLLLEAIELLVYLRQDPSHVVQAVEEKLPSAGVRAKRIQGRFKSERDYLNEHASHFGFTQDSVRHLIDFEKMSVRARQEFNERVLRENLGLFFILFVHAVEWACVCIRDASGGIDDDVVSRVKRLKAEGIACFELQSPTPS